MDAETADALRVEYDVYRSLCARFAPALVGWWDDGGDSPLLVIEDLSACEWPPPWSARGVEAVRATLDELARTPPPSFLPRVGEGDGLEVGWNAVADDPAVFLRLGLADADWLETALPTLRDAAASAETAGDALLHFDVRSDNVCLRRDGAVLVDWNWARLGNPALDLAFWLPSLHAEGGPAPRELLPGEPRLAALVAGFYAARAGRPPNPLAPRIRDLQAVQVRVALDWAAEELALEPLPPVTTGARRGRPASGRRASGPL